MLAGCSSVPSAYNPVDWAQSGVDEVSSWFASKPAPEGVNFEPPPAEGRPYPNLATVPKPPPRVTPEIRAQRQREIADLMAERQAALTADASLRTTDAASQAVQLPALQPAAAPPPAFIPATIMPPATAMEAPVASPAPVPASNLASASVASAVIAQRVGPIAFAKSGSALSAASQNVLRAAAQSAAGSGRVHLVPAQIAREPSSLELSQARTQAMLDILKRAGMPADRIAVDPDLGSRVDVYDVYVER